MASMMSKEGGKAALHVIAATIIAAVIILPIANRLLGSFLPSHTITV